MLYSLENSFSEKQILIYRHKNKILVDTREKRPLQFPEWLGGIEIKTLSADYSLEGFEDILLIERKSLSDLISCIGKDRERFIRCLERLSNFKHKYLLIEASALDIYKGKWRYGTFVKPNHVIGFLNKIVVDFGIEIWYYSNNVVASTFLMNFFDKVLRYGLCER